VTQVDLPSGRLSGLRSVQEILKGVEGIDFVSLTRNDVVRHEIVQKIVQAYEEFEEKQ
jgi:phosphate starvation-inducible PhoH-like protein